jgi:hypothetical protein
MNIRMKFIGITLSVVIGVPSFATADEAPQPDGKKQEAQVTVGTRTGQWLELQREGRAAGNLLPIPGAEAERSSQRYIDSFSQPIPNQLGHTSDSK